MAYQTPLLNISNRPLKRGLCYSAALILLVAVFLQSCQPDNIQDGTKPKYFDIAGYFKAQIAKQRKLNHTTLKSVTHNGNTETKKVHIDDWALELALFVQSDINKPAWRDSYSVQSGIDGSIVYTAKEPELRTREIVITRNKDNSIKWIMIFNDSKNRLYQTDETLTYRPDSLYTIKKKQHVSFLGTNNYFIKGSLN